MPRRDAQELFPPMLSRTKKQNETKGISEEEPEPHPRPQDPECCDMQKRTCCGLSLNRAIHMCSFTPFSRVKGKLIVHSFLDLALEFVQAIALPIKAAIDRRL